MLLRSFWIWNLNQTKRQKRNYDDQEFESENDSSLDADQFDPDQGAEIIEDDSMDIKIEYV